MLSILANPTENKPENLNLLNTGNVFITKNADTAGRTHMDQDGGFNFGQILETIGTTVINGYFLVLGDLDYLRTTNTAATMEMTTYNNRTVQCRLAVPIACKVGKTITGFLYESIYYLLQGTGVTSSLVLTLKKMATDGTLTTIATFTETTGASKTYSPGAVGTPTVMDAGDKLVFEIEMTPNGGTHNTTNYSRLQILLNANKAILNIF